MALPGTAAAAANVLAKGVLARRTSCPTMQICRFLSRGGGAPLAGWFSALMIEYCVREATRAVLRHHPVCVHQPKTTYAWCPAWQMAVYVCPGAPL